MAPQCPEQCSSLSTWLGLVYPPSLTTPSPNSPAFLHPELLCPTNLPSGGLCTMLFPCLEYSLCLSSELPMALRIESEPLNLAYMPYVSWDA